MQLEGKNIIGYHRVAGEKMPCQALNPATGETLLPLYHGASDADIEQAAQLSWRAFLRYRDLDDEIRAVFLERIATEIEALGEALIVRAMQETALPHS